MSQHRAVFLINLLQDVNIIRPLAYLAREAAAQPAFLLSKRFSNRDRKGVWRSEIERIARDVGAAVHTYDSVFDAYEILQGGAGVLVAASESNLSAHADTHDVFRSAPSAYLKVTLQHGYECVGFLQSRQHDRAHGRNIRFAADVLAGWTPLERQRSMPGAERGKYLFTGSTARIVLPDTAPRRRIPAEALVCENLHSVRFTAEGDHRDAFMEMFNGFAAAMGPADKRIALRPHPGGKRAFDLSRAGSAVIREDAPLYALDLGSVAYGVSPPSSVVVDLLMADTPVAVWRDPAGDMDADAYAGLCSVSLPGDVLAFRREALTNRDAVLERQRRFLTDRGLDKPAGAVKDAFLGLLGGARPALRADTTRSEAATPTWLVVADSAGATQNISFVQPFADPAPLRIALVGHDKTWNKPAALDALWNRHAPEGLVLSRYTQSAGDALIRKARSAGVPVVFHIDDDLLAVPTSLGQSKYDYYNQPDRLAALKAAMNASDVVYASTGPLAERLRSHGVTAPIVAGDLYCSVESAAWDAPPAAPGPIIGYMGTGGHGADLDMVLPTVKALLDEFPTLRFESFGTIKPPPWLAETYGDRVGHHPGLADYDRFLARLGELGWSIGLAPLEDTPFNRCKADTKWVEYSHAGIAVVATDLPVYHRACADGAGWLASSSEDWTRILRHLVADAAATRATVEKARARLRQDYTRTRLADQVLQVFAAVTPGAGTPTDAPATGDQSGPQV
ncbi:hypothetical protein [Brevundimonas sp.]|uniref:hypothetical protein n=1 Tax=Brevundimonas sp. TaxID=1871086 RepID=UPI003D6CC026